MKSDGLMKPTLSWWKLAEEPDLKLKGMIASHGVADEGNSLGNHIQLVETCRRTGSQTPSSVWNLDNDPSETLKGMNGLKWTTGWTDGVGTPLGNPNQCVES